MELHVWSRAAIDAHLAQCSACQARNRPVGRCRVSEGFRDLDGRRRRIQPYDGDRLGRCHGIAR